MSLAPGQRISTYEVVGELGRGGMGEVYRARDSRLERDVALKILRDGWDDDREHVTRFQREARSLAALNHPNVAHVYDFDQLDGRRYLVMELVEGEELAERIARGPLTLDETVRVCVQVAAGLEAAHEQGVVHRDLKPQNVRITPDEVAKVLDFGLAKSLRATEPSSETPTRAAESAATQAGALVGTPTYMSPERVRGRPDDRRGDIWAFGCVLYECLTGSPPFEGGTLPDTLALIVERELDLGELPASTPPRLRELITRCLDKDPSTRLRDIGEARVVLSSPLDPPSAPTDPLPDRGRSWFRFAALALIACGLIAWMATRPRDVPALRDPFVDADIIKVTDSAWTEFGATISRDGKFIAYASSRDGPFDAWVQQIGTWEPINLTQGTKDWWGVAVRDLGFTPDGTRVWVSQTLEQQNVSYTMLGGDRLSHFGAADHETVWSPDGTRVAYHSHEDGDPLYVAEANGAHEVLVAVDERGIHQHFPTWSRDGEWLYVVRGTPTTGEMDVYRVRPEANGAVERLTTGMVDARFLTPIDERTVLFLAKTPTGAGPWLWSLDVETRSVERALHGVERYTSLDASADGRRLVATVANPRARLSRVPMLGDRLATGDDVEDLTGLGAVPAQRPRFGGGEIYFVSSQGLGDGLWVRRDGRPVELLRGSDAAVVSSPAISPDGNDVAVMLRKDGEVGLWIIDRGGQNPRLLSEGLDVHGAPAWSPDGDRVAVGGADEHGGGLFALAADGTSRERLVDGAAVSPAWSDSGKRIAFLGATIMAFHDVSVLQLDTGEVTRLPAEVRVRVGEPLRFVPNSGRLVFMDGAMPLRDFYEFDLDADEPQVRRLTEIGGSSAAESFDVDPEGGYIVFDRIEQNSDVVLIELGGGERGE